MRFTVNGFEVDKRQVSADGARADPSAAVPQLHRWLRNFEPYLAIVNVVTYTPGGSNYSGEVQALAAAKGDAVIVPAAGRELLSIAPLMPYYDIDPEVTQYIGTALWNDPSLGAEPVSC